jgi:hypothetical protein
MKMTEYNGELDKKETALADRYYDLDADCIKGIIMMALVNDGILEIQAARNWAENHRAIIHMKDRKAMSCRLVSLELERLNANSN